MLNKNNFGGIFHVNPPANHSLGISEEPQPQSEKNEKDK